jgi:hypothetical protein
MQRYQAPSYLDCGRSHENDCPRILWKVACHVVNLDKFTPCEVSRGHVC